MKKLNIAVVGSGISGLSAAWLLSKHHEVTLYERNAHKGGHAHTVEVSALEGPVPIDTGFIVYNEPNYPNLKALFAHLGVATRHSEMTFAMSLDDAAFEYSGTNLNGFFGQRRNVFRAGHWQLLLEIGRFFRTAVDRVSTYPEDTALGDFLAAEKYSPPFIEQHILPMGAAIWSSAMSEMMAFPAQAFISFYANHAMLRFLGRATWRTVDGGSREYVRALLADCGPGLRHAPGARRIVRRGEACMVEDDQGVIRRFDHVVLACHADEALALLSEPDPLERETLACFRYQRNVAVLHRDPRFMPKRRRLWSAWNYLKQQSGTEEGLCVTYWMNELQNLPTRTNYFVTLNPPEGMHPHSVEHMVEYDHPVFDAPAMAAQQQLLALQGRHNTWFCGAHIGYGFHEDGLQSGLAVAEALGGVQRPWVLDNPNARLAPHRGSEARHRFLAAE